MDGISRRNLMIGSGLALTFAPSPGLGMTRPRSTVDPYDDNWNYGDPPWKGHPNMMAPFDPTYIAILHLEFTANGLQAQRVHFPPVQGGVNDWFSNKGKITAFLKWLNTGTGSAPDACGLFSGLENFAFDRPHHFIVYIKNMSVDYDDDRPVWFGKKLLGDVYGVNTASKNESFFGAKRETVNVTNGSPNLIYLKNYYHVGDGNGHSHKPIDKERLAYALKINATIGSVNEAAIRIPLLLDPDTGNMGEGQPPPLRPHPRRP